MEKHIYAAWNSRDSFLLSADWAAAAEENKRGVPCEPLYMRPTSHPVPPFLTLPGIIPVIAAASAPLFNFFECIQRTLLAYGTAPSDHSAPPAA